MQEKTTIKNGIVHGRFQPPHNGHIRYLLGALTRAEHLTIGICTPEFCSDEVAQATGFPCTEALNPFSYTERVEMIKAALEEAGVARDRYSFIPFPSDYRDIGTLVPKDTIFMMSVTSPSDEKKIDYLRSLGYQAETVMTIPETESRERSGAVRRIAAESGDWQSMVPPAIAGYIREHYLEQKLSGLKK